MTKWFADTYALMAYLKGSPAYVKLLGEGDFVTSALNMTELAYILRRRKTPDVDAICNGFLRHVVDVPTSVALDAAKFLYERRTSGADCSTVDAWGYAASRHFGIPFLTGDDHFRDVAGVKFVKE